MKMHPLLQAIHAWWHRDSIRISPNEGRLLQLECPCFVHIDDHEIVLQQRTVGEQAAGVTVSYRGMVVADERPCQLQLTVGSSHAEWLIDGKSLRLALSDVIPFQPTQRWREAAQVSAAGHIT